MVERIAKNSCAGAFVTSHRVLRAIGISVTMSVVLMAVQFGYVY